MPGTDGGLRRESDLQGPLSRLTVKGPDTVTLKITEPQGSHASPPAERLVASARLAGCRRR